ncbi:putative cinnamoyl-CoA reductase [Sclerotinia borealis F-4128]|uniref:Putative cinnamoyl-CoA reductase n=1 Tax=Sclerotinia borealis (strain F-4128) TaxID=1432307 RepID=W9C963_SCLBF|nr:putative cinnamoyl-CoA reductase [Sclerotinia borealis F-4128]
MTPNLLITGATGFIGFRTLLEALDAGYIVRAAIRNESGSKALLSHPKLLEFFSKSKLSFIEVPDILQTNAYTEALKDMTYAIHIASPIPLPFRNPQTEIIDPTVQGAANILEAALKTPSLKRMVITSSIVANLPFLHATNNPPPTTAESRVVDLERNVTEVFPAYCAAKIATLNATDAFVEKSKPHFDVVKVFPGFVYGKDQRATDVKSLMSGSNRLVLAIILGHKSDEPRLAGGAHVDDVAKVHVLALDREKAGTQDFGVTAPMVYDDAFEIVKKHFPKEVDDGVFKQGNQPSLRLNWNAEKIEDVLGFKFKTYDDMVLDITRQYLEFSDKAA